MGQFTASRRSPIVSHSPVCPTLAGAVLASFGAVSLVLAGPLTPTPTATPLTERAQAPSGAQPLPAIAPAEASYDIGLTFGSQLSRNGLGPAISQEALVRGLKDALAGTPISAQQKDAAQQFMRAARDALVARNTTLGREFLEKNARESGVRKLGSNLQYRVLVAGDPKGAQPGSQDRLIVRYRVSLSDGTELDNSDQHDQLPAFRLNSVIPAWREALAAMTPGAKWQLFVPPELGYGADAPPPIPPGALLIYELELLRVEAPAGR
jgi:FKBP-type peptidyl-prolyl cis-trans isomerase FklB